MIQRIVCSSQITAGMFSRRLLENILVFLGDVRSDAKRMDLRPDYLKSGRSFPVRPKLIYFAAKSVVWRAMMRPAVPYLPYQISHAESAFAYEEDLPLRHLFSSMTNAIGVEHENNEF